jgi:hypothetical protein
MRILGTSSEDEMVAAFLQAEIASPRWAATIEFWLRVAHAPSTVVESPVIADPIQSSLRRLLLSIYRGWARNDLLFAGFPRTVSWDRAALADIDVANGFFANCEPWIGSSGGTRRVGDLVARVDAGLISAGDAAAFEAVAARYEASESLAPPILVALPDRARLVVLEGHTRMTGWLLRPRRHACNLEVLLGTAPGMDVWAFF